MGEKGEGSGGKGGGNWEWGTPLSTPSFLVRMPLILIAFWMILIVYLRRYAAYLYC